MRGVCLFGLLPLWVGGAVGEDVLDWVDVLGGVYAALGWERISVRASLGLVAKGCPAGYPLPTIAV